MVQCIKSFLLSFVLFMCLTTHLLMAGHATSPMLSSRYFTVFLSYFNLKSFWSLVLDLMWDFSHMDVPLPGHNSLGRLFLPHHSAVYSFPNSRGWTYKGLSLAIDSIPLVFFSVFVSASHCLDYCSFLISFISGRADLFTLYFSFKILAFPSP